MSQTHDELSPPLTIPNRRRFPRFATNRTASLSLLGASSKILPVELHDVSLVGVSFSIEGQLAIQQRGELEMTPGGGSEPLRGGVVVRWATVNAETDRCRVGCEWIQPLTEEELSRFL